MAESSTVRCDVGLANATAHKLSRLSFHDERFTKFLFLYS
jgi:hypothetical protein